ncbi:hypothetical protein SteCoe_7144 [Stentor coeruleus]|uniref:Uncharacterized protein n=1 Tax=Stentor coeruleus TaxID=5963 RepID=A0A1R2CN53_9CILI|nr:hypothetical protein SteCoe_7144 [Stentor coeruleus]
MSSNHSYKIPILLKKRRDKYFNFASCTDLSKSYIKEPNDKNISLPDLNRTFGVLKASKEQDNIKGMRLNLAFRPDFYIAQSETKAQFLNFHPKAVSKSYIDKVFFRKKDELTEFAEKALTVIVKSKRKIVTKKKKKDIN